MGPTDSSAKMNNDRGVFIAISCEGLHQRARIYQLGLWLAIFFAIFLRLPPNKFLQIPPDLSPVSIRLALLFLPLGSRRCRFWVLCHEYRRSTRRCVTVREMKVGPSRSAIRC